MTAKGVVGPETVIRETVTIDSGCTACGLCLATCGPNALRPAARRPFVVPGRCTGCMACIEVCPRDSITLVSLGARE